MKEARDKGNNVLQVNKVGVSLVYHFENYLERSQFHIENNFVVVVVDSDKQCLVVVVVGCWFG